MNEYKSTIIQNKIYNYHHINIGNVDEDHAYNFMVKVNINYI